MNLIFYAILFGAGWMLGRGKWTIVPAKTNMLPQKSSDPTSGTPTDQNYGGARDASGKPVSWVSGSWVDHEMGILDHLEAMDRNMLASSLVRQWTYTVQEGDTPGSIAEKYVGDRNRYTELVVANPAKKFKTFPELNFESISVGEKLLLPKTWNPWISASGVPSGNGPYPPYHFLPPYPPVSFRFPAGYIAWPPEKPTGWRALPFRM